MPEDAKAAVRAVKAAYDGKFKQIAAMDFETPLTVVIPGPGYKGPMSGTMFGYGADQPVLCACLECQKGFTLPPDPRHTQEIRGACPDCGAVVRQSMYRLRDQYFDMTGKGGPYRIDIPVSREARVSENGQLIITDTVKFRSLITPPAVIDGAGNLKADFQFSGGYDEIRYEPGGIFESRLNMDRSLMKDVNGKSDIRAARVMGLPAKYELNKPRVKMAAAGMGHQRTGGLTWASPGKTVQCEITACDDNFRSARYAALAGRLGLPKPASERDFGRAPRLSVMSPVSSDIMKKMTEMVFEYPGVIEREINRVNENLKYHPEISGPAAEKMRFEALSSTMNAICAMDQKVSKDLHACKTAAEVDACLKAITFGDTAQGDGQKIKVAESDSEGYAGKYLKKQFNINPYTAAANAYTCHKLGFTDINSVRSVFEAGKNGGYPVGIVPPIESKAAMAFMKNFTATHAPKDVVASFYPGVNEQCALKDSISMYESLNCGRGLVKRQSDKTRSDYLDFVNQAKTFFRGTDESGPRSLEDFKASATFQREFGHEIDQIGQICWDMYQADPEITANPYRQCQDGKPVFENRSLREIHDVLSELSNRHGDQKENQKIEYTERQIAKVNRVIDGWDIHLARDTAEIWTAGNTTQTCVYGSYTRSALSGQTPIALMTNPDGRIEGVIELTKDMNGLNQIKGYRNTALCGDAMDIAHAWMDDTGINPTRSGQEDVRYMGEKDHYFYGNMNHFHGGARPVDRAEQVRGPAYISAEDFLVQYALEMSKKPGNQAISEAIARADAVGATQRDDVHIALGA